MLRRQEYRSDDGVEGPDSITLLAMRDVFFLRLPTTAPSWSLRVQVLADQGLAVHVMDWSKALTACFALRDPG
jgi:hypothetical protein